MKKLGELGG